MFCTLEVEEEREEAEGNPNGVVYAVAVKTDVEFIVGNLLRQIQQPVLCFCAGAVQLQAADEHWQIGQKRLENHCTLQLVGKSLGLIGKYPNYGQTTVCVLFKDFSAI